MRVSSYEIAVYDKSDVLIKYTGGGNYTLTIAEGAVPTIITINDDDKGAAGREFNDGNALKDHGYGYASPENQTFSGNIGGEQYDNSTINPENEFTLGNGEKAYDLYQGNGIGKLGYAFTFKPEAGVAYAYSRSGLDSTPNINPETIFSGSSASAVSAPSKASGASGVSGASAASGASGASGSSRPSSARGGSGTSSSSGSSTASGSSNPSGNSGPSGSSGSSSSSSSSGSSGPSGSSTPSGSSNPSGNSGPSNNSGPSSSSGPSGVSGPSGSSGPSGPSGPNPHCFTLGTLITTNRGEVPIETLVEGDQVLTEAHGFQPIRWICRREVQATGAFSPVLIRAGTLGATKDLRVSPEHRLLITGDNLELLFGVENALVAAKTLVNDQTILRDTSCQTVEYIHLLFDRHEIVKTQGVWSESFYLDAETVGDFNEDQRRELCAIFPGLANYGFGFSIAHPGLLAHEVSLLDVKER